MWLYVLTCNFTNYLLSKLYSKMEIKFKRISDDAIVPTQNTATDAGYDLFLLKIMFEKMRKKII